MQSNVIPQRVFDFLKDYPPFNLISREELRELSGKVTVMYFEKGELIFSQGDQPKPHFYIVQQGAVQLIRRDKETEVLVDLCDEGDVFGIRPLIAAQPYLLTARVAEDSILYAIRTGDVRHFLDQNPRVAFYLATNFAAGVRNHYSAGKQGQVFTPSSQAIGELNEDFLTEVQAIESKRRPIACPPHTSIQEAAQIMSRYDVGSIIVTNAEDHPVGILTDTDLRKKVATGKHPIERPVSEIMSSPVITMPEHSTVADAQIEMIKHRVHHLCVTKNGTPNSPIVGVISEHDLLITQGNSPAVLIREIRKCQDAKALAMIRDKADPLLHRYLHQEVAIAFIVDVMTEINNALNIRAIQLAEEQLLREGAAPPDVPYCWLALGSQGRGEQLLRTDQDNALVFGDVPEEQLEGARAYFLKLAQHVTEILHHAGFEYCPADMMASNVRWCLSLSEWKAQFAHWIFTPNEEAVLYSNIFFDYRPVHGDERLAEALTASIFENIGQQTVFLSFLAKSALQNPPPLGFFRNIMVEKNGEHKNEFDLKARAMMPLTDAARVLVLESKIGGVNNTFKRFERMAEHDAPNAELYREAADAYELLMRFRALQGLRNNNSGRFFNPEYLSKTERLLLRNSFRPIAQLQELLTVRFRLNYLR